MECEFYVGTKDPVILDHAYGKKTNIKLLEKHSGIAPLRAGNNEECQKYTGLLLRDLHPFLENYLWKVVDEHVFENEKIYVYAGNANEILEMESNALKYVIGVINGLLAAVCE